MTIENGGALRSVIDALCIVRQAAKHGEEISIEPCTKIGPDGQKMNCANRDPKLNRLCTDPDGVMPNDGVLVCPKQRGTLVLRR